MMFKKILKKKQDEKEQKQKKIKRSYIENQKEETGISNIKT